MANPFYMAQNSQKTSQNQTTLENALYAFSQIVSTGKSPQIIEQMLFSQNPKLKQLYHEIQQSGMNPIDYARNKALQKNIDINPTLEQMLAMIHQNT